MSAKAKVQIVKETPTEKITQITSTLKEEVDQLAEKLLQSSEDNLKTVNIPTQDESLKIIIEHINKSRVEVLASLQDLTATVIKTVKSMTESSRTLDSIHSETGQLADYSSTIASAGEELSATISTISQNVQNTKKASELAKNLAVSGDSVVTVTVDKIKNVSQVISNANESLARLKETAEQANTIVRVVNDISSKTDLLALNASIEAARAGAAGKGFAVVAHEVGRLSEKTQASINEIETILKNIQKSVDVVSKDLQIGTSTSEEALNKVGEAKQNIDSIVQQIEHVNNEVSNIGSAIKEQGQAVIDIANNVSTISKGSNEVNSKINQLSEVVDSVTKGSNTARNLLGVFKLGAKSLLLQSQVDHLFWMHRLRRMLEGKENIQPEEFTDHTKCRLGKWYFSLEVNQYNSNFIDLYEKLNAPHEKLHSLAAQVIRLNNGGDNEKAFEKYEECLPLSLEIVKTLESMMAEIGK